MNNRISRRTLLQLGATAAAGLALPRWSRADDTQEYRLTARPTQIPLVGTGYPETTVWAYNGQVPGPELRLRQGQRLRVLAHNALAQSTTVHWHGLRIPNAMDGVPYLTQEPIQPGAGYVYEFDLPDAGTFWYHPHQNSAEQVGRGLYGALIVEEPEPIQVDRELVWVLDDWRLQQDASISDNFGAMHDLTHAGRIGNVASINGQLPESMTVRAGERIRLRLINAANARTFALLFEGHTPQIIALDGQPVEPHAPAENRIVLGAAMRADVIIDMQGQPGETFRVIDTFYQEQAFRLITLNYSPQAPLREHPLDAPIRLPANPLPEPDLRTAERHAIMFSGGAMGGMQGAMFNGEYTDIRTLVQQHGVVWAINGIAHPGMHHSTPAEPLLTLQKDRSYILHLHNETVFWHPMHLHGHSFRVLSHEGQTVPHQPWRDTVLIPPREHIEVALVANNPGDWMFHCHILEHQQAGMMAILRVA